MVVVVDRKHDRAVAERTARMPLWMMLGLIAICQIAGLLAVEYVLYAAGLGEEEIFKFDKQRGFKHMPNKRVTWRTEGYALSYFNADGLRESDVTAFKPANTYRVALLGDSMVEGLQVPIEQTFGQLLQKRVSLPEGKHLQIVNFATSGYSTVQEYLQLQDQVLKFQPDLVLVCYNSRDIFENWSPPDQVLTNVRPFAVHLPGRDLIVDNAPVLMWMSKPRAKFLMSIEWIREHSRIYGLISAIELDWSQHNPWYRAMTEAMNHPKKFAKEWPQQLAALIKASSKPAFSLNSFDEKKANPKPAPTVGKAPVVPVQAQPGSTSAESVKALAGSAGNAADPEAGYRALIARTMTSLLLKMKQECAAKQCELAVAAMPARAALCPAPGMETAFGGIDYAVERQIVSECCKVDGIAYHDCEQSAEKLPDARKGGIFYAVHLTPAGQSFIADDIEPFITTLATNRRN